MKPKFCFNKWKTSESSLLSKKTTFFSSTCCFLRLFCGNYQLQIGILGSVGDPYETSCTRNKGKTLTFYSCTLFVDYPKERIVRGFLTKNIYNIHINSLELVMMMMMMMIATVLKWRVILI